LFGYPAPFQSSFSISYICWRWILICLWLSTTCMHRWHHA
jgi:hypothetical protein